MLGTLLAVIGSGFLFMTLLFLYWLKYIYVEKDDDNNKSQYKPISNKYEDKDDYSNQTVYKVDQNFIKRKKKKKD